MQAGQAGPRAGLAPHLAASSASSTLAPRYRHSWCASSQNCSNCSPDSAQCVWGRGSVRRAAGWSRDEWDAEVSDGCQPPVHRVSLLPNRPSPPPECPPTGCPSPSPFDCLTWRSSTGTLNCEGSSALGASAPSLGPARLPAAAPPAAPTVLAIQVSSPRYQSREARAAVPAAFCWRRRNLLSRKRDLVACVLRSRRATAEGLGSCTAKRGCTQMNGRQPHWKHQGRSNPTYGVQVNRRLWAPNYLGKCEHLTNWHEGYWRVWFEGDAAV